MSNSALFYLDKSRFGGTEARVAADVANLSGDYTYLTDGYYASLDVEHSGRTVLPTTAEALDAYVVAIAMEKARLAGVPTPDYQIVLERFPEPPLMAYPINPFSLAGELLLDAAAVEARRRGLTYTGKYAVLAQALPDDYRIDILRLVLGRSLIEQYDEFGARLFELFRLPLMRVRVIVTPKQFMLSAIEPLPFSQLTEAERGLLEGMGTWRA